MECDRTRHNRPNRLDRLRGACRRAFRGGAGGDCHDPRCDDCSARTTTVSFGVTLHSIRCSSSRSELAETIVSAYGDDKYDASVDLACGLRADFDVVAERRLQLHRIPRRTLGSTVQEVGFCSSRMLRSCRPIPPTSFPALGTFKVASVRLALSKFLFSVRLAKISEHSPAARLDVDPCSSPCRFHSLLVVTLGVSRPTAHDVDLALWRGDSLRRLL